MEQFRLQYLLDYPIEKITATDQASKREAFEAYLVPSIAEVMVSRMYAIAAKELPHFAEFIDTSESSDPILAFREWKKVVENRIAVEKDGFDNKAVKMQDNEPSCWCF